MVQADPFASAEPAIERIDKFDDMLREDVTLEGEQLCYVASTRTAERPRGVARGVVVMSSSAVIREVRNLT